MKKIVLLVWLAITLLAPMISEYMTLTQLAFAYVVWMIWYFTKVLDKTKLNYVICTLGVYYSWIYLTDQFITNMPYIWVFLESLLFFVVLIVNTEDE